MEMTIKQIGEQLVAIQAAIVEKTGKQPFLSTGLNISDSGRLTIHLYREHRAPEQGGYDIGKAVGETYEEVFADAFRIISEIPDANTAAKRTFHKNLANVIDEGNALNLPKDVMAPLNGSMKAMSENLLTHEGSVS